MNETLSTEIQNVALKLDETANEVQILEQRVDEYHPNQWVFYPPGTKKTSDKNLLPLSMVFVSLVSV